MISLKSSVYIFLTIFLCWMRCSVDPLSPDALRGTWAMLTFTDKEQGITFLPDIPVDIGNGVTQSVNGILLIGSAGAGQHDPEINIIIVKTTTIPGTGSHQDISQAYGDFTMADSTLTISDILTGRPKVFTLSRRDFRLTLTDEISQSTWGKVD